MSFNYLATKWIHFLNLTSRECFASLNCHRQIHRAPRCEIFKAGVDYTCWRLKTERCCIFGFSSVIWQCSRSLRSLSTRWAGVGETAHVVVQELRKTKPPVTPVSIQGVAVNIYEYLGVHTVNKLLRSKNTLHKKPPLFPEEAEPTQKQTGGLHQSLQLITLISAGNDSHNQPTHLSPYLICFALFSFALVHRVLLILKYIKIHL